MWVIIFRVSNYTGTEGKYKNILIAKRHLRKLQKRYTGTNFTLIKSDKKIF